MTSKASINIQLGCREGGVVVQGLDQALLSCLRLHSDAGGRFEPILKVMVAGVEAASPADPGIAGCYRLLADGIRFTPSFSFEPGLSYRVVFDPGLLCPFRASPAMTRDFSVTPEESVGPVRVNHIFPSSEALPENLLRFYVCFSQAMERGRAEAEISLLGPDGTPAASVLYRAPVEFWDGAMQVLTILLDPGRLKRGVGPNRELGPPLKPGGDYGLVIGAGMTDRLGRKLGQPVSKRFRVIDAVRQPVGFAQWWVEPPAAHSRQPLIVNFATSLDWAMLFNTITIVSEMGTTIGGRVAVDRSETRWNFTPNAPWSAGCYRVRIDPVLEDPCGNNLVAAFDRHIRDRSGVLPEVGTGSIAFEIALSGVSGSADREAIRWTP